MINENWVKQYCCEPLKNIENYKEAASSPERWVCHHRWEISSVGRFSKGYLISIGIYWKRPACELIFMRMSEHRKLHTEGVYGNCRHTEEQKRKWSEMRRGTYNNGVRKANEARKIPVVVYRNGELFGEFSSILEASKMTGFSRVVIQRFMEGRILRNRKGFVFQRKTSP